MKISTGSGDEGNTATRMAKLPKDHPLIEFLGTVDEVCAALGLSMSLLGGGMREEAMLCIGAIQEDLVCLSADLAGNTDTWLQAASLERIETWGESLEERCPELTGFILPGGCTAAASLHVARAVVRRAERCAVCLDHADGLPNPLILPYLNRLSDVIFVLARVTQREHGIPERVWTKGG